MSSLSERPVPSTARAQTLNAARDIACGSVAGIVAKFGEYPFDTVKVRLQSQPHTAPPRYTGPLDCLRQSLRHGGIKGMYRGVSAPLLGAAAENASLFMSYALAQDIFRSTLYPDGQLPLTALVACGALSGAVTSLVLNPVELLKCKMQVQTSIGAVSAMPAVPLTATTVTSTASASFPRPPGPLALIASIYRHHGILGFWYGQTGTLLREVGGTAAYFGTYEGVSSAFRSLNKSRTSGSTELIVDHQRNQPNGAVAKAHESSESPEQPQLPVYQRLLAGASAGMAYNFLFYPADTIKSTMQTESVHAAASPASRPAGQASPVATQLQQNKQRTFWTVGSQIYRSQGIKGFYRGCGLTVCRSAPASALIFTIYERVRDLLS